MNQFFCHTRWALLIFLFVFVKPTRRKKIQKVLLILAKLQCLVVPNNSLNSCDEYVYQSSLDSIEKTKVIQLGLHWTSMEERKDNIEGCIIWVRGFKWNHHTFAHYILKFQSSFNAFFHQEDAKTFRIDRLTEERFPNIWFANEEWSLILNHARHWKLETCCSLQHCHPFCK